MTLAPKSLKLILKGNYVWVWGRTPKVDNLIDEVTKFQPKGFEHSDKFKEGKWSGWSHLYKFGKFPLGLIDDVEMILILNEIEYQIIDERVFTKFPNIEISADFQLRMYQIEALNAAIKKKRGIIALPTGSGKTIVGLAMIAELKQPALFYTHRKELLYQAKDAIKEVLNYDAGQVGDGVIDLKPITVVMLQTASMLPAQLFSQYPVVIFDECHVIAAETFFDVASQTNSEYLIGLSATPGGRPDGKDMLIYAGSGNVCYKSSTSDLIESGYLARPIIHIFQISPMSFNRNVYYHDVYERAIVLNDERNQKIAIQAVESSHIGKTYVHVKSVAHGKRLTALINEILGPQVKQAEFIYGSDTTKLRKNVIQRFKHEDLKIVVSTLLNIGFDLPDMQSLILASGGKSSIFIRQVFGRLLRMSAHKIVDFYDFNDPFVYLYDHFIERVKFYKSERAFVLDEYLKKVKV